MKTIIAEPGRNHTLDLVRGFTALFIPFIHTLLMFADNEAANTVFIKPFIFIAEWPGAQLFLFLMGYHFENKQIRFAKMMERTLLLFGIGYFLNIIKFQLPVMAGLMPGEFVNNIIPQNYPPILIGDILHTAALSIPFLFVCKQVPYLRLILPLLLIGFLTGCSQFEIIIDEQLSLANHFTRLIVGQPPHTYFPLFPWLAYPLAGFMAAMTLNKFGTNWMWAFIPFGANLMIISKLVDDVQSTDIFYKPSPWQLVKHIGFVFWWIGIWDVVTKNLETTLPGKLLCFCSRHLTVAYCIQWPLICLLVPLLGFRSLSLAPVMLLATVTTACTYAVTALFINHKITIK